MLPKNIQGHMRSHLNKPGPLLNITVICRHHAAQLKKRHGEGRQQPNKFKPFEIRSLPDGGSNVPNSCLTTTNSGG